MFVSKILLAMAIGMHWGTIHCIYACK